MNKNLLEVISVYVVIIAFWLIGGINVAIPILALGVVMVMYRQLNIIEAITKRDDKLEELDKIKEQVGIDDDDYDNL